jgi:hypothetical protein
MLHKGRLTIHFFGVAYVHAMSMDISYFYQEKMMTATAVERIVVQTTSQEKKNISTKAKRLGLPVSELMRRGAAAYQAAVDDEELGAIADAATAAANRASDAIDDVLSFVNASNKRIAAMEAKAIKERKVR